MSRTREKEPEMTEEASASPDWFTVFRTDDNDGWLFGELKQGRLRQGWGVQGLALTRDGKPVGKVEWEGQHRKVGWGDPSRLRFAILRRMLEVGEGDIAVIPKMPQWNQFSIARVSGDYYFENSYDRDDFGHILPVDPASVRTFNYRANDDAYLVSGVFSRANHRPAVSFCYGEENVAGALRLLDKESNLTERTRSELSVARMDDAFRTAARQLQEEVLAWNGQWFEEAVRQAFHDQGYKVKDHPHYDGKGGDVDILVSPPIDRFRIFLPDSVAGLIAVQVKWKQGVDRDDTYAVKQIVQGAKLQKDDATTFVMSSASKFTEEAEGEAAESGVTLIGGLQTMCFLLGFPERYRREWEENDQ